LDHWEERWADTRIHGTTKRQVAAMFAEEKRSLLPLPIEPFRYYQYGERVVGVLSLAKKFGTAAVDDACAAALEMGVQEYRFVRRYLERCPQVPLTLHQLDPLIRELVQYRDLINYRTKEQENEPD
jgi:hypothetical protein